jgi:hypothetical protein
MKIYDYARLCLCPISFYATDNNTVVDVHSRLSRSPFEHRYGWGTVLLYEEKMIKFPDTIQKIPAGSANYLVFVDTTPDKAKEEEGVHLECSYVILTELLSQGWEPFSAEGYTIHLKREKIQE